MAGSFARVGDQTTGHGPYPPNTLGGPGSPTVFIEGVAAALVGDGTATPCVAPNSPTLNGVIIQGSPTVQATGKAIARIGDMLSCGCMIVGGGNTVGGGANG
tara:strand:- start:646 stop:951 length:306 start_codon:yes stop_codon:yes gene_type:complete